MAPADEQVCAEDENGVVALHLLTDALLERLSDSNQLAHAAPFGSNARPMTPLVTVAGSGVGDSSANRVASATTSRALLESSSNRPGATAGRVKGPPQPFDRVSGALPVLQLLGRPGN